MSEEEIDVSSILEQIKSRINSAYGKTIACDSGWHELVCKCHLELLAMDPNYEVFQIKEKFGSLRYYFGTRSTDLKEFMMWKVSEKYTALSENTCEITGKAGKLMFKQGLYKTLAEEYENDGWKLVDGVSADEIFGVVPPE
jgi:hypothetical protein